MPSSVSVGVGEAKGRDEKKKAEERGGDEAEERGADTKKESTESEYFEQEAISWCYSDEHGTAQSYGAEYQTHIEAAYASFLATGCALRSPHLTLRRSWRQTYLLDFALMRQCRLETGTRREIRRATTVVAISHPAYSARIAPIFQQLTKTALAAPRDELVDLLPLEHEFALVAETFHQYMPRSNWRIVAVQANLHKESAELYEVAAARHPSQAMLWHGFRSAPLQTLLAEGLDARMSAVGQVGRGIYVSANPLYSHSRYSVPDSTGQYALLLVKCSLGRTKRYTAQQAAAAGYGLQGMVKPPVCEDDCSRRYQSVQFAQAAVGGEKLFCLYSNHLTYIAYVVRYGPALVTGTKEVIDT